MATEVERCVDFDGSAMLLANELAAVSFEPSAFVPQRSFFCVALLMEGCHGSTDSYPSLQTTF
jgi:hypothetical protein